MVEDKIKILIVFQTRLNQITHVLYSTIEYFNESVTISQFKERLIEIMKENCSDFDILRIVYVNREFNCEVDLPSMFLFEDKQQIIVICSSSQVSLIIL